DLREAVAPGPRREAVPALRERLVGEPVHAPEVDHDRVVAGRLERCGLLVAEAEEDHVRSARGRLDVRREHRNAPVERWMERVRGPSGERVRAERDQLELGMAQEPVERLLPRVACCTQYGGG